MSPPNLASTYPWATSPLIISAPTRPFATSALATTVSLAGGLGFLSFIPDTSSTPTASAAGTTHDLAASQHTLASVPRPSSAPDILPIGIGYLIHSAPLSVATTQIQTYKPAAVWLFAPTAHPTAHPDGTLRAWAAMVRRATGGQSKVWVQVGSVAAALDAVAECGADITLVVQGTDAGGHGLRAGAGIVALLPEVADTLAAAGYADVALVAAGGIVDARGAAAAFALGAAGVVLGTRFMASTEAAVPAGFRESVIAARDGGQSTFRTDVFDRLRGTKLGGEDGKGWPEGYGARGVRNVSSKEVLEEGVPFEEVKKRFDESVASGHEGRFGVNGRDVTYVGTAVGLVTKVMSARDIVAEVREGVQRVLRETRDRIGSIGS